MILAWSKAQQRLHLVTDAMGMQPIYLGTKGPLRLSTEQSFFDYEPDVTGWGSFMAAGYIIGEHTQNANCRRLAAGSYHEFSADGTMLKTEHWWDWPEHPPSPRIGDMVDILDNHVRGYGDMVENSCLLLSSGFDSRIILGLLSRSGVSFQTLSVRHSAQDHDIEGKIAASLGRAAGLDLVLVDTDPDFFSSETYLDYLLANEGVTSSLYLFIAQVFGHVSPPAIWDGLYVDYAFKNRAPGETTIQDFFRAKYTPPGSDAWQQMSRIFSPELQLDLAAAFQENFDKSKVDLSDDADGIWRWDVENRMRHRVGINPFKAYSSRAVPLVPGCSKDFFTLAQGVKQEDKLDAKAYLRVFNDEFPQLAKVPFYSGNKLIPGTGSAFINAYTRLQLKTTRALDRRPGLARMFGLKSGNLPSRFFDLDGFWAEDDDELNWSHVRKIRQSGHFKTPDARLLFHWRVSRWIADGTLKERLR
ncbi:MAG: hypothetical protein H8E30_13360 [Alphaproteobacteria bacterium]|nr:hypothetical protein [Alphaproteobacteria bacterium]